MFGDLEALRRRVDGEYDRVGGPGHAQVVSQEALGLQEPARRFGLPLRDDDAKGAHHEGAKPPLHKTPHGFHGGRAGDAVALHLIGLGLHDATDITVKGLERVRACDHVYAEFYTAILGGASHDELVAFLEKDVQVLEREGVETGGRDIVAQAADHEVALLTAGDPLAATTHTDLMVRARAAGVPVHVVHAPSIYSAAPGLLGLQHYKFGRTTTLVRPEDNWLPESMFDAVQENHDAGLHTLVLLDIKAHEPRPADKPEDWPQGYYMTADEGLRMLLRLAEKRGADWFGADTQIGVVARAGSAEPLVVTGPAGGLAERDFGRPLHCLVVPGQLQVVEEEAWASLQ